MINILKRGFRPFVLVLGVWMPGIAGAEAGSRRSVDIDVWNTSTVPVTITGVEVIDAISPPPLGLTLSPNQKRTFTVSSDHSSLFGAVMDIGPCRFACESARNQVTHVREMIWTAEPATLCAVVFPNNPMFHIYDVAD